ncbi:MAG: cell surface protein, partial [Pseudoxanthomonas suwonensis]
TEATDAVNKGQLDAVAEIAETTNKYFKASGSAGSDAGAYVEGDNATAAGEAANAIGAGASAFGGGANAIGRNATASGFNALAGADSATAVGGTLYYVDPDTGEVLLDQATQATEAGTTALGAGAQATAAFATANGAAAQASGLQATASGYTSVASGLASSAYGGFSEATGDFATALGYGAEASATRATAVGISSVASGDRSTAMGNSATASGSVAVAVGNSSRATQLNSTAVGGSAWATGEHSTAVGQLAFATRIGTTAVGRDSYAYGDNATAIGRSAWANGVNSVALGAGARATEANVVSVGNGTGSGGYSATRRIINLSDGTNATDAVNKRQLDAVANNVNQLADTAVTYDDASKGVVTLKGAEGTRITNLTAGELSDTSTDAVNGSQLHATNQRVSVVETRVDGLDDRIGDVEGGVANAVKYEDDDKATINLEGSEGTVIGNVAAGSIAAGSMQAINGGQMYASMDSVAQAFGGGMTVTAFGVLSMPTYAVQGGKYYNVGSAIAALDSSISILNQRITVVETQANQNAHVAASGATSASASTASGSVTAGPTNIAVAAADASTAAIGQGASVTAEDAVALGQGSVADRANSVSVGATGAERQVTNVAAGTQSTDAVNKGQLDGGVAQAKAYADSTATQAVTTSKAYTDAVLASWNENFLGYQADIDLRFQEQDRRIDRQGAMSAAMLNMATSAAGIRTQNRLGVGLGFQNGESALSIGYQRAISDRATVTLGGAFTSDDQSVGVGAGFGW